MSLDVYLKAMRITEVYQDNITHNLNGMAEEAGIYKALWRPDEINIRLAKDLVPLLREGLVLLESDPERFKKLNPGNGWGDYYGLVEFVKKYLTACILDPDAEIEISR